MDRPAVAQHKICPPPKVTRQRQKKFLILKDTTVRHRIGLLFSTRAVLACETKRPTCPSEPYAAAQQPPWAPPDTEILVSRTGFKCVRGAYIPRLCAAGDITTSAPPKPPPRYMNFCIGAP